MTIAQPTTDAISSKPKRPSSRISNALAFIWTSRIATIGLFIVLFWVVLGLISFVWTPADPNSSLFAQNLSPNAENWLGTDSLGRDTLSRLMTGAQVILLKTRFPGSWNLPFDSIPGGVAILGVLGSLSVGSIFGLNAGYRGGWTDQIIMQVLDAMIAFPRIVLYLVVISALGQGDFVIILAITITGAPGVARLARSLALDIKTRDYIRAAETRGESVSYILFREILPNARGPLIVDGMLRVGYAIFTIATLGFLGIGLPPPDPDWGNMVDDARTFVRVTPWPLIWPALAISTLVIGLNLFADGVREELTRYQK